MINYTDVGDALVYLMGNASDKTPETSELVIRAWEDHFSRYPDLTGDDLMAAVVKFCEKPRERLVQPQELSAIALQLCTERMSRVVSPIERNHNQEMLDLCREALCDAKAGDATALSWLLRVQDYHSMLTILWCKKRGVDFRASTALSGGGPVSGSPGGSTSWLSTERRPVPKTMIKDGAWDQLESELRGMLTEDECWAAFGDERIRR